MSGARERSSISPVPLSLLGAPLDFLLAEHLRQRQLLACIGQISAVGGREPILVAEILGFLRHDMVLHVQDEEEGLFPLMRRRCPREDEIERVLSKLSIDHASNRTLADRLAAALEAVPSATPDLHETVAEFTRAERRHLALENAVVLPLARFRLRRDDLAELSARMNAIRRGTRGR